MKQKLILSAALLAILAGLLPAGGAEKTPKTRALQPGEARFSLGQQEVVHRRGKQGEFPTFLIAPKARVPISLKLSEGGSSALVGVGVMDGGRVFAASADGSSALVRNGHRISADGAGQVNLIFEADAAEGVYRVFVHRGAERYFFEFWVGSRLPTGQRK